MRMHPSAGRGAPVPREVLNQLICIVIDPVAQTVRMQNIVLSPEGLKLALGYGDPVMTATIGEHNGRNLMMACRQHAQQLAIYYPSGEMPPAWSIQGCNVPLMDRAIIYGRQDRIVSVSVDAIYIRERITWQA